MYGIVVIDDNDNIAHTNGDNSYSDDDYDDDDDDDDDDVCDVEMLG